jgi:hypothetical protein
MVFSIVLMSLMTNLALGQTTVPSTQPTGDVPVKAVVLFSSGVGYFEHFGTVNGDAATELHFKTTQINDILKSLVLQDLDGGTVGAVTYPSQDPLAKTLKSFQVDITNNPPLADLLNQLRGAQLTVSQGAEKISGTVLGVETKQRILGDSKTPVPVAVLNLLAGATIRAISLDDVQNIQLDDPKLQDELNRALVALAQSRDQDKKPVTINFRGQGERRVRLGYVVETPIWKTSYRLLLGEDKPQLQGWAIVENQTDNDWNNIQLSLVSGRPISFVENLYQPLYIPRPVVEPELFASLRPQTYDAGLADKKDAMAFTNAMNAMNAQPAMPVTEMANRSRRVEAGLMGGGGGGGGGDAVAPTAAPMNPAASVASVASATEVGELFQYTIGNVSLSRQKSAMLPIITDPIEVERVSIYNQSVMPTHPLNGARVTNTTGKHLLQGPVTVIDAGTYAGDAQIDNVPPGQERLLSYGIDLQMLVDATKNTSDQAIQSGRIVKGVLYVTRKYVSEQDYVADNKSDKDKTLIIEHPRRQDWTLVDTNKPMETTDALYRFKGVVPAGKSTNLAVKEQMVQDETLEILPGDVSQIDVYSRTGEIPKAVRDALAKAVQLKNAVVDTQRQMQEHDQALTDITTEQSRIRDDMKAADDRQAPYYVRLLKKLDDQETTIEKLQAEKKTLQQAMNDQQKALEDYLANLNVG